MSHCSGPFAFGGFHIRRTQDFRIFRPSPSSLFVRKFGVFLGPPRPFCSDVIYGSPLSPYVAVAVVGERRLLRNAGLAPDASDGRTDRGKSGRGAERARRLLN